MTKEEEAAALQAVCARRGLHVPQNDADSIAWKAIAMDLAKNQPEFQERGEAGRPNSLTEVEDFICHVMLFDIRHRWHISQDVRKSLGELEACRQLGEAIGINPETLKSRLRRFRRTRKTIKKIDDGDPKLMAQLSRERDKTNKIILSYMEANPQYMAEILDFMQFFNGFVDKITGEN